MLFILFVLLVLNNTSLPWVMYRFPTKFKRIQNKLILNNNKLVTEDPKINKLGNRNILIRKLQIFDIWQMAYLTFLEFFPSRRSTAEFLDIEKDVIMKYFNKLDHFVIGVFLKGELTAFCDISLQVKNICIYLF